MLHLADGFHRSTTMGHIPTVLLLRTHGVSSILEVNLRRGTWRELVTPCRYASWQLPVASVVLGSSTGG